jgi:phytoene dehydrogenase-like protein
VHVDAASGKLDGMAELDAVVVGAGPNGLTAANVLASAGLSVAVFEAADRVGGGARTDEGTLPGFRHDPCSAVHPLGAGSPVFGWLDLGRHGLTWLQPELAMAHPFPDGSAAVLARDVERTAASVGVDAGRYRRLVEPFRGRWFDLAADVLRAPLSGLPRHPLLLARFGVPGVLPACVLARAFRGRAAQGLLAGLAAHAIAPLWSEATGALALLFALAAHAVGWPIPQGGSQAISDALAARLRQHGGRVHTGVDVADLADLPTARAYLLDTSPRGLSRLAGDRLPAGYRQRLGRYRYGPAAYKIDYALAEPVPWRAAECRQAGTVHLGASMNEIGAALGNVARGALPDPPFLITSQPTVVDPSRAPDGRHVLWAYGHVPNGWTGDFSGAVERQIERFAPGFTDLVLARRVIGPAEFEAGNANYIGGDIACGAFSHGQSLIRPVAAAVPYATPNPSIYLCSAATPPGPGVHGMCGYHAARTALRRVFGLPAPDERADGR